MLRSFSLAPRRLSRRDVQKLAALQPSFNQLYDAVSRDIGFVAEALGPAASACAWNATEMAVYQRVAPQQAKKPRLLLPNSVFLESYSTDASGLESERRFVLSVGNVQAGEPYQLQLVHTLQSAERPHVLPGPLRTVCAAIATTARLVHPDSRPCVAVLTKPNERLCACRLQPTWLPKQQAF